jgi:hypothetical protein
MEKCGILSLVSVPSASALGTMSRFPSIVTFAATNTPVRRLAGVPAPMWRTSYEESGRLHNAVIVRGARVTP